MAAIEKIKMQGFKSFAKATELPLGSDFSVILGPNGSGKSNLSDAICFVLGRLSAKSLRADKSANLIYNGGKKGQPAKNAEVSITFDNSNKIFPSDSKKIKISRYIKQNGQSVYRINDEVRTRQQILELLGAGKINPDGYNIVLQGDIVHMTEMPAEERRRIIEDISGIGIYEEKKEKALRELEKTDSKLNDARIVLKERETYLNELKKDRDHAAKYRDLEKNIKRNKATFLHLQIKDKESKREDIEKRVSKANEDIEKIRKGIDELRDDVNKKKEEISAINKDIEEKGEVEQVELHRTIEDLKEKKARDQARFESLGNELNRINIRKQQLELDLKEIDEKIIELSEEKKDLTLKKKVVAEKETLLNNKLQGIRGKSGSDEESSLIKIEQDISKNESELEELGNKKRILLRDKDKLELQLGSLSSMSQNKEDIDKLKELKTKVKDLSNFLEKSLKENDSLVVQLSRARSKLNESMEEQSRLNVRNAGIQENLYGDVALKKIKELKIKGIHGTIAELGHVDKKFSTALEVAAGGRIKSVVVDDDKVASQCIKYLKDNKLGVVTFLPLNKLKVPDVVSKKVGYGLALSLIKYDKRFDKAFTYVFGNTVVVENINQARNIGVGKIRMVTLDGDLIESSGAMIGGFRSKKVGSFRQIDLSKDLDGLDGEINRLREIIDALDKRKLENEENVYLLKNDRSALEGEIIKLEKSFGGKDSKDLLSERKQLEKNLGDVDRELKTVSEQYRKWYSSMEDMKKKRSELREKVSRLAGGGERDKVSDELRQISEERVVLDSELKNIDIQIRDGLLPEKENIIRILKEHEKEISEFQKESEGISNRLIEVLKDLKQKEKAEKEFYSNFKNMFNKRNKLTEEIQSKELKSANEFNRVRGIEDKVNSSNLDRAKIVAELEGLKTEFEEFQEVQLRKGVELQQLKDEIRDFERMMGGLGNVNLRALEIYDEIEKEYKILIDKADKIKTEKEDVMGMINEIEANKGDMFMKSFNEISRNFERIFSELTDKGTAHLVLEDKENPFNGGIRILVRIAKGKYLDIKSLSGGEKTLTALAFIFAMQEHDPGHFYVFDEVDAALDKANSMKLAKLIKKYSERAQYIVISHNDYIIGEANQLYGVSMREDGISKIVSLKV